MPYVTVRIFALSNTDLNINWQSGVLISIFKFLVNINQFLRLDYVLVNW